jgi:hygromycin-B 7''-O-kinase
MLPLISTLEEFKTFELRQDCFLVAARSLLMKLGLASESASIMKFPASGSLPVVLIGDQGPGALALKFFPSLVADEHQREISALKFLAQQPGLAPRLIEAGDFEGWHYVLMTRLAGQSLKEWWAQLAEPARLEACRQVGRNLRAVHRLSVEDLNSNRRSWKSFLEAQVAGCYSRHEKIGLREDLLKQIPDFLNSVKLDEVSLCFLHTEVMRDHVFFSDGNGELAFQGFIDFEPSMAGAPEYDFASVGVFLASGDRGAIAAFYEGYGCQEKLLDPDFKRRVMAYLLLHKYSNLKWYLQFMPDAKSLDELAELWWT